MLTCFISMARLEHFTREGHTYLGLLFLAFLAYGIAGLASLRGNTSSGKALALIVLMAALFRVPLWWSTPTLSTDVWRYLWDGRLMTQGVNPYQSRVDDPRLSSLRTDLHPRIDHQWMASPYPPAAQAVFAAVYWVLPERPLGMQVVFTVFDLACIGLIVRLLRRLGQPTSRVILYAWNPLVVVEFAHGAHIDSLATLLILAALSSLFGGKKNASAAALGLATLTKFIPALLLPVLVRQWGIRRTLLYGAVVGVAFVPFLGAGLGLTTASDGTGIFGAARIYADRWRTNDGLFYWLVQELTEKGHSMPVETARTLTRLALALAGGGILLKSYRKPFSSQDLITNSALHISVYLLLTSAMFPWYVVWLVALLPLLPYQNNRAWVIFAAAWLLFSATVNLSYLFYLDPANPKEVEWIRRAEYYPLFALLGAAFLVWLVERSKAFWLQSMRRFGTLSGDRRQPNREGSIAAHELAEGDRQNEQQSQRKEGAVEDD
jgi:hypothetical protein